MKKLLMTLLTGNILLTSVGTVVSCASPYTEQLDFDLTNIDETVFQNYDWTVDQMLGSELGGFQTLRSTVLEIMQSNFYTMNILKVNVDIYYGYQVSPNQDYLIDFNAVRNLLPITYFSIHITPNNQGSYLNEKWITVNTNVDLSQLSIFQNETLFYSNNPVPMDSVKLMEGFAQSINRILQTDQGYEEIVTYYRSKKMWNDNKPLPKGFFNLEINAKQDESAYLKFDAPTARLVFDPTVKDSSYKAMLDGKGFAFKQETTFLSVWNVTIESNDFNANDWRNVDWKPVPNKTYDGTTTVQDVVADVTKYLVEWSAHVHNSHFMQPQDVEVILKKGAQATANDPWPSTTQLKDLWKSSAHGNLPYVFAWFKDSKKSYIKINNKVGSAGTHVSFKLK
ncbi:hypothetical protein [Spiroplasma sp. SV19]|uniref:hypothetical protein n=1 Tax=Spiroplasma sp. SV19 TaxID=2570468 RepID=UPI0024B859D3|nr:hypothetical protein [Spiroplasma sp. SV19]WHQ37212.1 hypothetical protein E7Y35_04910 [Spiroplasma sp. SV19]